MHGRGLAIKMGTSSGTRGSSAALGRDRPPAWLYVLNWELTAPGGVNEVVRNLFDLTAEYLRHRPVLLIRDWGQWVPVSRVEDGRLTIVACWPAVQGAAHSLRRLGSLFLRMPQALWQLRRLLKSESVDTIHVHYPGLESLVWPLVIRTLQRRPQLVISFHGLDLRMAVAARGLDRLGWRLLLQSADRIVVCSKSLQALFVEGFPVTAARVRVIPNGVDTKRIERAASTDGMIAAPAPYIFCASTYESRKGLDVLLQAFDVVAPDFPKLSLVIAGRYEEDAYARLNALRLALAAGTRIQLLKNVPHTETMRLLGRAACFALASREEAFGIVLLEAGTLAVPTIATSVCGALAYFDANAEVNVVPPNDVAALAASLRRVLSDPVTAHQMAASMRSTICAKLEWSRVISAYMQAGEPRPGSPRPADDAVRSRHAS